MNKPLIKKAMKKLITGKVTLSGGTVYDGKNYCAIGYMAATAGLRVTKVHPFATTNVIELCKDVYGIDKDVLRRIVHDNDKLITSKGRVRRLYKTLCTLLKSPPG